MKKKEKIVILVLLIITIAVIIFAVVRSNSGDDDTEVSDSSTSTDSEETEDAGDYATYLSDGTKLNTSSKLNEEKTLEDGITVSDIQLTESGNVTQLLATLTNTTDETQGGYVATLTLYDEDGEVLITMNPYISELASGETTQLNTSAVFDYANAYDFTIEKQ